MEVGEIWDKINYPEKLRKHCLTVNAKALEIADNLISDGITVDRELVNKGSLLHDIGRGVKHNIQHGIVSYEKCKEFGLSEEIALIARNHVGSGIRKEETKKLGLPEEDFMPTTIEQKIVSYADNLTDNNKIIPFEKELKNWRKRWGPQSKQAQRLKLQHEELENYITSKEMKELEKTSGKTTEELMENAGKGIGKFIKDNFKLEDPSVLVVCGAGNNGGDGFVAARYLQEAGIHTELVGFTEQKTELSKKNFKKAEDAGVRFYTVTPESAGNFSADIIVDAMIGTGLKGVMREPMTSVINWLNTMEVPKISIDVPSGINPDTGERSDTFVKPDYTLCMHRIKKGLVGNEYTGELEIVDIL